MRQGTKPAGEAASSDQMGASKSTLRVPKLDQRLAEAFAQQAATSEILRVISRSPTDARPVFDTIAAAALKLCNASSATVARKDGEQVEIVALASWNPEAAAAIRGAFPRRVGRDTAVTRALLRRSVVTIPDVLNDPEYAIRDAAIAGGYRSAVAVPLMLEGHPIGSIAVVRPQPGDFPDTQIALLETFANQAVIAIENARLFNETKEALEQQTATSEVLRVISESPTDVQPVFDTIAAAALKLCRASAANVFTFDGELVWLAALITAEPSPDYAETLRKRFPMPVGHGAGATRAIMMRAVVEIPDVLRDPDYAIGGELLKGGFRSVVSVPLIRDGSPIGAISVGRPESGPFPGTQIALLQTFAKQAVIAIENVRLFNETKEALEQQTATSDILRVISQSPRDVQPVFEIIAQAALKLCSGGSANVLTFDGALLHLASAAIVDPAGADAIRSVFPRPPDRETAASRAVLTRSVVAIPDVLDDPDFVHRLKAVAGGFRSIVAAPLMRGDKPIGAIAVGRPQPGAFPDKQVALLQTFADQAVIAIENVRLFTELDARNRALSELLERQTATSEILRVISSSPTDVQPVFDIIGARAEKLCAAEISLVSIVDGDLIRLVAFHGENPEGTELVRRLFPMPLSAETVTARTVRTRAVVHVENVLDDPTYEAKDEARRAGFRASLGVPMLREGRVIGVIFVSRRTPGHFADSQVALLKTFADQAVIAIENGRLFTELDARTQDLSRSVSELKALGEVGQAVSSTLDLPTVLSTIVSRATTLAGMDGGAIFEYDEAREVFHLHTTDRLPQELIAVLGASPIPKGEGAIGALGLTREPVQIRDIADDGSYHSRVREILVRLGYRSLLAVPLLREDRLLGGLVVNRKRSGDFSPQVIELLRTFATQSALAIQNARLYREIENKSRQLEVASRHKSEFLANMSHELRTPLNAIIGFSEVLSERMFGEINAKQAEYIGDILQSGQHLLSLINDILDLSKIEAGRMELEQDDFDLPNTIDDCLLLVRERAQRRGIALVRSIDERLGMIRADERKVKQVLLNLLSNALKFTPEGGKITVSAAVRDGVAEITVADTGVGIAPEDLQAVFEEFRQVGTASKKGEGTGLGLAISRKFIELHGGKIWVTSQVGSGSTFAFNLPVR